MSRLMGRAVLLAGYTAFCMPAEAQERRDITAEEAMENYRAAWSLGEPEVDPCAEEAADADTIVVCHRRVDPERYKVESEPDPRMDETASGAPRAPDVDSLPPCEPACIGFGSVPEPVTMVDVEAFPEPLSPQEAENIFAVPKTEDETGQAP